ncbi:hypothetical protein SAMN04488032_1171 [Pacificibacter marinus]|uniref:Uncharacterized protein n=1 Tax=Pacificibacter marinus TaxID=658057 RepID=A0A1Y5RQJ9_9RHOB|nr:hypothetical protein SAMN04488032_1171 [Pacificibacter marinus]SLN22008.1 hypothetical protein PAM7971_00650 [Pacificibacter marinus]
MLFVTAVFEPVAFAVHLENVDVMGQAIQQRACQPLRAEDLGPFIKGQVRGNDDGPAFVALRCNFKEQFRARFTEQNEAQLINDQEVLAGKLNLSRFDAALLIAFTACMDAPIGARDF